MRTMLKKVAIGLQIASDEPLEKFERLMRKKVVVLIVDEIDMLFKQHGGVGETWFKMLISWAEDKEMRFSLIGISNCVNDMIEVIGNLRSELKLKVVVVLVWLAGLS